MEPIRLIAVDLDGTLFDSSSRIPARNLAALWEAASRGVYVAVATGRIYLSAQRISASIAAGQPYLSSNGAVVGVNGEKDFRHVFLMDDRDVEAALKRAAALQCEFHLHTLDGRMLHLATERKRALYGDTPFQDAAGQVWNVLLPQEELLKECRGQTIKLLVQSDDVSRIPRFRSKLDETRYTMASSWFDNVELMAPGADKGGGLRALASALSIPLSQVMALGDNENDLPMFRAAGFPVAMGNASPAVKREAKAVTLTNDLCGVAHAVEEYILHS